MLSLLIEAAYKDLAPYPQYKGYFRDYRLCRVLKEVKTKMGIAFSEGEVSMGVNSGGNTVVWSVRNKIDTVVEDRLVEWL